MARMYCTLRLLVIVSTSAFVIGPAAAQPQWTPCNNNSGLCLAQPAGLKTQAPAYSLDISGSGDAKTLRVWDQSATGITQMILIPGSSQVYAPLLAAMNNSTSSPVPQSTIDWDGSIRVWAGSGASFQNTAILQPGSSEVIRVASNASITFGSTSNAFGPVDTTLSRVAPGVIGVGNSSPGGFAGTIIAAHVNAGEVLVKSPAWPDYVFDEGYRLMSSEEIKAYIQEFHHLPGMPSASEVRAKGGVELGDMQGRLLRRLEELTLLVVQANERIKNLENQGRSKE